MSEREPGFYKLSDTEYHSLPEISKSKLDRIDKSPAHYKHYIENGEKDTKAKAIGSALHKLVLEPKTFFDDYIVHRKFDIRKKADKKEYENLKKSKANLIQEEDFQDVSLIAGGVFRNQIASDLIMENVKSVEEAMFWTDEQTGIHCKAKTDVIRNDHIILDLKSTDDASPIGFARSVRRYRYYVQDAFYSNGYYQLTGIFPRFVFVVVEKKAPYVCSVYELDDGTKEFGLQSYENDLRMLKKCQESNYWPGYSDEIETLSIVNWG